MSNFRWNHKKGRKLANICRETLWTLLKGAAGIALHSPFSRRWTKNGKESDTTAKKVCWWIWLSSLYVKLKQLLQHCLVQEEPAKSEVRTVLPKTQSDCRTAHGAHCRKKDGLWKNWATKRWNYVWKAGNPGIIWTLRELRVCSCRSITHQDHSRSKKGSQVNEASSDWTGRVWLEH